MSLGTPLIPVFMPLEIMSRNWAPRAAPGSVGDDGACGTGTGGGLRDFLFGVGAGRAGGGGREGGDVGMRWGASAGLETFFWGDGAV